MLILNRRPNQDHPLLMAEMLIGYARCSTRGQDLRVQRSALKHLGVDADAVAASASLVGVDAVRACARPSPRVGLGTRSS